MTASTSTSAKGFFGSLFDFSFSSYVTPKLIKIIYGIVMAVSGLVALLFVIGAFRANAGLGVLTLVIIAPLFFFFYLILYRVMLEVVMAVFKIAENTTIMAAAVSSPPVPAGGPVATGFPQAPGSATGFPAAPPASAAPQAPGSWGTGQGETPPAQPGQAPQI